MKQLLLILLIIGALGVGLVQAHDFSNETIFLSDVDGGNITFAYNFTATTYTVADNQSRFTVIKMNNNGTWTRLGFRNPWANATIRITHLGTNYIAVNATVAGATVFEVWLPDAGEPDSVTGADADNWVNPSLDVTMNNNGVFILEWSAAGAVPVVESLHLVGNDLVGALFLITVISIFSYIGGSKIGISDEYLVQLVLIIAALMFVAYLSTHLWL